MIISHKHQFIFIKAPKVAGTSFEVALSQHCGADDIITNSTDFNPDSDEDTYKYPTQNNEGCYDHMLIEEVKKIVTTQQWNQYTKISIIRNPWDRIISIYFYQLAGKEARVSKLLTKFKVQPWNIVNILNFVKHWISMKTVYSKHLYIYRKLKIQPIDNYDNYYFDAKGEAACDIYIRYEHLQENYNQLCSKLGLPSSMLPRLKTKQRKAKVHYSKQFTNFNKKAVAEFYSKQINFFRYTFKDS